MIKLTGLTKRYPGRSVTANAVDGIDLDIPEGKLVTLLGPSGCGKTTTLRLIAGLERADQGVIEIGGQVVSDPARGVFVGAAPAPDRHRVPVVRDLAAHDRAENVMFPLRVTGRAPQEVSRPDTAMQALDIGRPGRLRRPPGAGAVRWAAAAGRAGARARPRAQGAPARRAAEQPRQGPARPDARRDPRGATAARHHHRVRHPRPGRGAGRLRRRRRDERRARDRARPPAGDLHLPAGRVHRPLPRRVQQPGGRRRVGRPQRRDGRVRRTIDASAAHCGNAASGDGSACSCGRRASGCRAGGTATMPGPARSSSASTTATAGTTTSGSATKCSRSGVPGEESASPTATRCSWSPIRRAAIVMSGGRVAGRPDEPAAGARPRSRAR